LGQGEGATVREEPSTYLQGPGERRREMARNARPSSERSGISSKSAKDLSLKVQKEGRGQKNRDVRAISEVSSPKITPFIKKKVFGAGDRIIELKESYVNKVVMALGTQWWSR